jgi:hypothetical protein
MIRSLFPSRCTTTSMCGCTLTLPFWPMIRIIVGLHNDPIVCSACSSSLWHPIRLYRGGHHCHFSVWTVWSSKMVTVALQYDSTVIHYWPQSHEMNSDSVGHLIHQLWVLWCWWQNRQWLLHPTVIELHLVFIIYLPIQMGLNNLLNTHHTDIIITHHSSCPQCRVLFVIRSDTNITTVSTQELIQAVHRWENKGSTPYRLT